MTDLTTPEGRLAAARALGPDAYNQAMREHITASICEEVNGHPIRAVDGGRQGRLFSVGDPINCAFSTIEQARQYAKTLKPALFMFEVSLTCGDMENTDAHSAAKAFRELCLEADCHPMQFEVKRQHDGKITYVDLEPAPITFDPTNLTDDELTKCLYEMRRRGAAVAIYDVPEILTMTDGWENQPDEDALKAWFDRDHLEEVMCDAARREITDFIDNLED